MSFSLTKRNVCMAGFPVLAPHISGNGTVVSNDGEANSSLPLYHHVRGRTISEKQAKIRNILQRTIYIDRLIYSPDFFTSICRQGMNKILIRDSDRDYRDARVFLTKSDFDRDEIVSLDIRGPMTNEYFFPMSKLRNLREVALEPDSLFARPFFCFLKEQELRTLQMKCVMDDCIFQEMKECNPLFQELRDVLQVHCTALRVLSLSCTCREHEIEMTSNMAKLVRQVLQVKKICLATSVRAARELIMELEDLLSLDVSLEFDVYVNRGETICPVLRHHFDLVKSVTVKDAGRQEILDVRSFHHITKASFEIIGGGETELIALPTENIEILNITASPMAAVGNGLSYYELSENALSMAISHMPKLKSLTLVNCRVAKREIYKIMEVVAGKLESLEMSIMDQEECPSQRLLDVCIANIKFNPRIRKLKARDDLDEGYTEALKWGTETFEDYSSLYRKLVYTRELLTCTAPMLDPWDLTIAIQSLFPYPNVIAKVQNNFSSSYASSSMTSEEDYAQTTDEDVDTSNPILTLQ